MYLMSTPVVFGYVNITDVNKKIAQLNELSTILFLFSFAEN
jgi:hypothetical protein